MGIFDRFRGTSPRPQPDGGEELVHTLGQIVDGTSSALPIDLRSTLAGRTLLLAVQALPPNIGSAPAPLDEDTPVAILTSINARGAKVLLAFTSVEELTARKRGAPYIAMPAIDAFTMVLEGDYAALVINPAGRSIEVSRQKIHELLI